MANELNIALSTGLTVTAQAYTAGAASGSAISLSEVGSSGFYTGNMTGSAGTYQLVFLSGGATVGTGQINWSGTAEIPFSTLTTADIPTAAISAIQAKTDNLPSDPADQSLVESAISALSIPTVVQIRTEMDSNSTKLANLDATISSRSTLTTGDLPSVPSAASVASAVRTELTEISNLDASVSSRLASADYTAPTSAPTAAAVASAVRTELGTELGRIDQSVSSRLASADYTTPPTTAQISAAVEGSLLNEADGQQVLNALVGAIGNSNVDQVALVAAIRSDLERTGGKIDSIPTDAAPSAASVASAVWSASTKEITGGVVDTLTNSPDVPTEAEIATAVWGASTKEITGGTVTNLTNAPASVTPADIWDYNDRTLTSASGPTAVEIRQEIDANSSKLDVAISSRLAGSAYTAPANSDITAIKAKTDALPSDPADQSLLEAAIAGVTAPTAGQVASQVRTELSVELGRIDAAISSRLAPSGTLATVTTLTNAPTVPTAAAIADEVRVELATELARLDAPVSGATAPSAATVASQVRTELTAELAKVSALNTERLANVATTAIVGNLLAQANS